MSRLLVKGGTVYTADASHSVDDLGGSVLIEDGLIAGFSPTTPPTPR